MGTRPKEIPVLIRRALAVSLVATALLTTTVPAQASTCPKGVMALTFDDGPTQHTPATLQALRTANAPGVFFVVGSRVDANPHMVRYVRSQGHQVLHHTYAHERLTNISDAQIRATIKRGEEAMARAGSRYDHKILRPPYGAQDARTRAAVASAGYRHLTWTVSTTDWHPGWTASQITNAAVGGFRSGAVILFHDGTMDTTAGPETIKAIPQVVAEGRKRGYCFGVLNSSGQPVLRAPTFTKDAPPRLSARAPYLPIKYTSAAYPKVAHPDLAARLSGDFDGDGRDELAWFDSGTWKIRRTLSSGAPDLVFTFGQAGDRPVVGDWNGNGTDGIGVLRNGQWLLRQTASAGSPQVQFAYGRAGDLPLAGDWNASGTDTVGLLRNQTVILTNSLGGAAAHTYQLGRGVGLEYPLVGDFNGDGRDTVGLARRYDAGAAFKLTDSLDGATRNAFVFGHRDHAWHVIGDWDGDGRDGIGVEERGTWRLRQLPTHGAHDLSLNVPR
jgi:peptidoglycan/xylan/chitin deacetylase (PgdA/CDA1 family)